VKIARTHRFKRAYKQLPDDIKGKLKKQLRFLTENVRHPSLRIKKIKGTIGIWETGVDKSHRFTFEILEDTIILRNIGNRDEVLKQP